MMEMPTMMHEQAVSPSLLLTDVPIIYAKQYFPRPASKLADQQTIVDDEDDYDDADTKENREAAAAAAAAAAASKTKSKENFLPRMIDEKFHVSHAHFKPERWNMHIEHPACTGFIRECPND